MSLCSPRAGLHGGTGLKEAPDYPLVEQQAEQPPSKGTPVDGEEMVFRGCGVHMTRGLGCSVTSQLCIFFLLFDGFPTVLESTSESCRVTQALCRPALHVLQHHLAPATFTSSQVPSHLRTFAHAGPSAWRALPPFSPGLILGCLFPGEALL